MQAKEGLKKYTQEDERTEAQRQQAEFMSLSESFWQQ